MKNVVISGVLFFQGSALDIDLMVLCIRGALPFGGDGAIALGDEAASLNVDVAVLFTLVAVDLTRENFLRGLIGCNHIADTFANIMHLASVGFALLLDRVFGILATGIARFQAAFVLCTLDRGDLAVKSGFELVEGVFLVAAKLVLLGDTSVVETLVAVLRFGFRLAFIFLTSAYGVVGLFTE